MQYFVVKNVIFQCPKLPHPNGVISDSREILCEFVRWKNEEKGNIIQKYVVPPWIWSANRITSSVNIKKAAATPWGIKQMKFWGTKDGVLFEL